MLNPIDRYFLDKEEPLKSCLTFLRGHILHFRSDITEHWSYGMPTYHFKVERFCYLWIHKKEGKPYVGFIDGQKINHPDLLQEKRSRMKIWLVDAREDIHIETLNILLEEALLVK